MFKSRLTDPSLFINSIATIGELIDEGIFKLGKDGISFIAADRAMVAVVDFKISSTAFEKYELDAEQSIGLNVTNFLSVLKRCGSGDKLSLSLQDNKLEVLIENSSKRRFVVPLLDLSKEEVPPIDQLEFTAKAIIKPDVIQSGIEDAEIIADAVLFETSGNKFIMKAEGDVSKAELELERGDEALIDLKADGEIRSRYPLGYLKKMIKASKIADSVSIQFGQDYPMKLEFKAGDKASLTMILAPRVSEE
jgi:proliferating cell nuclear antigen